MTTHSAEAKLYTGIRSWCVDKNISAAITSSATFYCLPQRIKKTIADLEATASIGLTNERYKTYGGGNNVITPGDPVVIDNTDNAKIISSLVCKFPTYFRIDVEKLQLPEGTDCVVHLEEGWILEGDFPGSTKQPSPEVKDFFTFRTPWYSGLLRFNTAFTISENLEIRRQGNAAASAYFNPSFRVNAGRVGYIDLDAISTLASAPEKKTGILFYQRPYEIVSTLYSLCGRLLLSGSTGNSISSTMNTNSDLGRIRFGVSPMTTTSTMSISAVKTTEIVLEEPNFASMTINAVKTTYNEIDLTVETSTSTSPTVDASGIAAITTQSSLELVTDIRMIMQTNLNSVDYLGTPLSNNTTISVPIYRLKSGTSITIYWGDGQSDTFSYSGTNVPDTGVTHTYAEHGEYDVRIKVNTGYLTGLATYSGSPQDSWYNKLKHFVSFGHRNFSNPTSDLIFRELFAKTPYTALKVPYELPTSGTTTADWRCENLFEYSKANPVEVSNWKFVGRDLWLGGWFNNATNFNQPLNWDLSNLTGQIVYGTGFMVSGATSFNQPLTFFKFSNSYFSSSGQFGLPLSTTAMNSENWNRTLIAVANAVHANSNSGFIATITRPGSATTNSTNYGGTPYNTGTGARTYLTSTRGWTVG